MDDTEGPKAQLNLLTLQELSQTLKVSANTIYYWISRYPDLPCHKIGRHLRFVLSDVLAYWDDRSPKTPCQSGQASLQTTQSHGSLTTKNASRADLQKKGIRHGNI
ncbi:MAG: helix-turn-helix domain-containing protein [Bdellovibrio sp.]|nr:helix-turn-helix domain-containing protein [Bdellovibrio sp.]